ncbi:hypothetical protein [Rubellicoccus peritrichatus]|uniref:Uncharacterized protein n=1 Tax=Rubellicoccus peritrichatus TaxID=3080537 RepID=A0AAQ3LAR5_9BACT|nr:hypothetical protein [Puniceicoccus sp. CR14]WOO42395.1 hypothetical protein RZN69_04785 [Puniceicoccus sp. CR14]
MKFHIKYLLSLQLTILAMIAGNLKGEVNSDLQALIEDYSKKIANLDESLKTAIINEVSKPLNIAKDKLIFGVITEEKGVMKVQVSIVQNITGKIDVTASSQTASIHVDGYTEMNKQSLNFKGKIRSAENSGGQSTETESSVNIARGQLVALSNLTNESTETESVPIYIVAYRTE